MDGGNKKREKELKSESGEKSGTVPQQTLGSTRSTAQEKPEPSVVIDSPIIVPEMLNFGAAPDDEEDNDKKIADEIGANLRTRLGDETDMSGETDFGEYIDNEQKRARKPSRQTPLKNDNVKFAAFLLARVAIAVVLILIGADRTVRVSTEHILQIVAFFVCALGIIIGIVTGLMKKTLPQRSIFILIVTGCAAVFGDTKAAIASILILEIGTELIDYWSASAMEQLDKRFMRIPDDRRLELIHYEMRLSKSINRNSKHLAGFKMTERYFAAAVIIAALLIAIVPAIAGDADTSGWATQGAAVAVAVTCGYIVDILAYLEKRSLLDFVGKKMYPKSASAVNKLSRITSVVFTKTGVITDGKYVVTSIKPVRISEDELLYLAAYAETYSDHPVAMAIKQRANIKIKRERITRHSENRHIGNAVEMSGQVIAAGSIDLMEKLGVKVDSGAIDMTTVFVSVGRTYVGSITLKDSMRPKVRDAVRELRTLGVENVALMTGDNSISASRIGKEIGVAEIYADCSAEDKVSRLKYILKTRMKNDRLAFVTNSLEDEQLLSAADVGILMDSSDGAATLTEKKVDLLINGFEPAKVSEAIDIAKQVYEEFNRLWLLFSVINMVLIIMAAAGVTPIWLTAILELLLNCVFLAIVYGVPNFGTDKKKK